MLWLALTVVILCYLITNYISKFYYWRNRGLITHIKPWPIFGSMFSNLFRRLPLPELLQQIYKTYPDAKYIGIHQFTAPVLVIRDPEIIKQITVKEFDSFMDRRVILTEDNEPLFGKNLLSLKGDRWKNMRSTLSPAFTSSKMRIMITLINNCANQLMSYYSREAEKENGTLTVEMKDLFTRYTNDVIATTAFGIECDSFENKENEFFMAGKKSTEFGNIALLKVLAYVLFPRLMTLLGVTLMDKKVTKFFYDTITTTVKIREEQGTIRPDMLHLLIEARKRLLKHDDISEDAGFATVEEVNSGKDPENKAVLTDDDIVAQAFLFFFAGYDTSSTMMSFMGYELALNSEIQKQLQREIDEVLESCDGNLDYDIIRSMKYLDMVVSESLRKWPPAVLTERQCNKTHILKNAGNDADIIIEKDISVWIPVYSMHHDSKYFPDPERFDPERFNDENKNKIEPFTYLPFGAGPRNCIGSRFALLEIKILFVFLLAKFDIIVVEKTPIPLKLDRNNINMVAEGGIWLGLKVRH